MFSIIIPTFNAEKHIDDTLLSIKKQSFQNFELIICDYSSSDSTLQKVNESRIENIRIVNVKEKGVPSALNAGFDASLGEYLCWLNADDVFLNKNTLLTLNSKFKEKNAEIIIGDFCEMNSIGNITNIHMYSKNILDYRLTNIFTGALFFKKEIWNQFSEFSNEYKYSFEYEFLTFIYSKKKYICEINTPLACLRIHNETLTYNNFNTMNLEALRIQKNMSSMKRLKFYEIIKFYGFFRTLLNLFIKIYFKIVKPYWLKIFNLYYEKN